MEEFAHGWCSHHFSFSGADPNAAGSNNSAHWHHTAPSPWPSTGTPFYPPPHPSPAPPPPTTSGPSVASPPYDPSSDSSDSDSPEPSDPGPVREAPPDSEARAGYLRLLLATETHRRELQRRRKAEQAPPPLLMSADTERLRKSQLRQLYGSAAERVAAAESRAQLEFDSITDRHRPPLWPNIPIKIRFAT